MSETTAQISTAGRADDGYHIARELELFASERGFVALQAYYICGEIRRYERNGKPVYSDEAHLWCDACATRLLKRARRLTPRAQRLSFDDDHFVCPTDAYGEDSCPHCMACGETLEGTVSKYCVEEELANYAEHPIYEGEPINPRQAVHIAMVCYAAPNDPEVIALGRAALAAAKDTQP